MHSSLKYPPYAIRLKQEKNRTLVFDPLRKKWYQLSPEEWVRQHLINYLIVEKKFPSGRISVEKELVLNDLSKRYDLVVFDGNLKPYIVIECKAPYIELDQSVIDQALRYNIVLQAPYVMISNGVNDFVFSQQNKLVSLPNYLGPNDLENNKIQ